MTDATGKTIDFTNTIIIATSNAGTTFIQEGIRNNQEVALIRQGLLDGVLHTYFKPELINRFDGVVVFRPLDEANVIEITRLLLRRVISQMATKGITLEVTEGAIAELAQEGYDPLYGARPLKRVIQERLDGALAQFLLKGKLGRRDVVVYDAGGVISVSKAEEL